MFYLFAKFLVRGCWQFRFWGYFEDLLFQTIPLRQIMSTSSALNGTTAVLSLISAIFFVVGCVGYADQREAVENASWIHAEDSGVKIYFGLSTVFINNDNIDFKYSLDYGGTACVQDFCGSCQEDGKATVGLVLAALVFAGFSIALSAILVVVPNSALQIGNLVGTFFSAGLSLIGVSVFMKDCMHKIDDDITTLDLKWGPGSILSILGMLLMWVAVIVQVVALLMGNGDDGGSTYHKGVSAPAAAAQELATA